MHNNQVECTESSHCTPTHLHALANIKRNFVLDLIWLSHIHPPCVRKCVASYAQIDYIRRWKHDFAYAFFFFNNCTFP